MTRPLAIRPDDLSGAAIRELLREHLDHMAAVTPAGSVHALDLEALRAPKVSFWSAWDGDQLVGCGALVELDATTGEIKSMRTAAAQRQRGIGSAILAHIVAEARRRGYTRLYLETGRSRRSRAPGRLPAPRLRGLRAVRRLHRRSQQRVHDAYDLGVRLLPLIVALATPACSKADRAQPPRMIKADAGPVAEVMLAVRKAEPRYTAIAYVGAEWCEPCQRFKKALAAGELDTEFPNVLFVEFDHDADQGRLDADNYGGEMIPRFVLPDSDGRAGLRRFEGSIKGPGGVANITEQLSELLARR